MESNFGKKNVCNNLLQYGDFCMSRDAKVNLIKKQRHEPYGDSHLLFKTYFVLSYRFHSIFFVSMTKFDIF
jgi:hypothetical protein